MWDPELVHVAGLEQSSTSMPSRLVTLFCFTYSDPKIFIGCIEQWILCRYSAMDKQTVASWPWRIPAMDWYGLAKSLVSSLKACHFLFFFWLFCTDSNAQVGGYVIHFEKQFTYTTVRGAGHMVRWLLTCCHKDPVKYDTMLFQVPAYQPVRGLDLFRRFLNGTF